MLYGALFIDLPAPNKRKEVVTLNYIAASDKHVKFHKAWRTPTRVICGGVGTGKTIMVAYDILSHLTANPAFAGKKALVVGVTGSHCRDVVLPEFLKILSWTDAKGRQRGFIRDKHYKVTYAPLPKIELYVNGGSTIHFVSLDSGVNLRGYNVSIVYADDIGESDAATWDVICDRAFREEDGVGSMIATLNPTNKSHWAYKRFFEAQERGELSERVYVDTLTMYDNPTLQKGWADKEQRYAYSNVEFRRKILGEWCSNEGMVYSAFDREKHIIKRNEVLPLIAHSAVYTGHDFGGKDPTTCVWIAAHQNKYYIFREYFSDKPTATIKDHTEFINRQTEPVMRRFSDHYTETVNTYKQYGVGLTLADKGPGSLKMGIATVNQLFADDRLFVSEDCKNVIRELESNEWRPLKDEPKPGNDHTLDALRYVLFEIAGKNRGFKSYFATDSTDTSHLSTPKEDPTLIQHLKKAQENNLVLIGYEQNGTPIFAQGT